MTSLPILYSFRRCPYAMRARLAIVASGNPVELREVVLRDKPPEMLEASPKGTVPVLVLGDGKVLEESRDIMDWALAKRDREAWLEPEDAVEVEALVREAEGAFKSALDRYKYPDRYEGVDPIIEREKGAAFIRKLDRRLSDSSHLFGERFGFADAAILPFVRQFAHVDRDWFWGQPWPHAIRWLDEFLASERFAAIMEKYPQWRAGDAGVRFGGDGRSSG